MDTEAECKCNYNPLDDNDMCYCPYKTKPKIRKLYPIQDEDNKQEEGIVESLSAFLARHDWLTPG